MKIRKIKEASRTPRGNTYIKLEGCNHDRSLGGHFYKGKIRTPSELLGMPYECHDGTCGSSR